MKTLMTLAISGLMATSVYAGGDKNESEKEKLNADVEFTKLDTDHDASLTQQEIANNSKFNVKGFSTADINQDGKLSREEFFAWTDAINMGREYSSAPVEETPMKNNEEEKEKDK